MSGDSPARIVVFGVRGLLEFAVLVAVAYWGYTAGTGLTRIGLALGAPLVVIVVWGALGSPKAPRRLPEPYRGALSLVLFGVGAGALVAAGLQPLAAAFALVAIVDTVAYYLLGGD
jgi:uncharacterized membrane protein